MANSLYAHYLAERTDDRMLETEQGFVIYRFLEDKRCYIIDIFVVPACRQSGAATSLANKVVDIAKAKGCIELLGTVRPSAKSSTTSLAVLLGYGMQLHSATQDCIVFRKDI